MDFSRSADLRQRSQYWPPRRLLGHYWPVRAPNRRNSSLGACQRFSLRLPTVHRDARYGPDRTWLSRSAARLVLALLQQPLTTPILLTPKSDQAVNSSLGACRRSSAFRRRECKTLSRLTIVPPCEHVKRRSRGDCPGRCQHATAATYALRPCLKF